MTLAPATRFGTHEIVDPLGYAAPGVLSAPTALIALAIRAGAACLTHREV